MKLLRARGGVDVRAKRGLKRARVDVKTLERRMMRLKNRRKARQIMVLQASAASVIDRRHIEELIESFRQVTGETVDLERFPDAWLMLSAWDEHWLQLTAPSTLIEPAWLLIIRAEVSQLISLLRMCHAISSHAAENAEIALEAVIESRLYAIFREYGKNALTVRIAPAMNGSAYGDPSMLLH